MRVGRDRDGIVGEANELVGMQGGGPMTLVLTFFDTPIAAATGASDIVLPSIVEAGCDE